MNPKSDKEYNDLFQDNLLGLFSEAVDANLLNFKYCSFYIRTMNSQQKAAEVRQNRIDRGLPAPPIMICSITDRCNLQCIDCHVMERKNDGAAEMSPDRFDNLCAEAHRIGIRIIFLSGGEPLLRPDIMDVASSHREIFFPVFSNGLLINSERIRFFDKNKNLVPVLSFDADSDGLEKKGDEGLYTSEESVLKIMKRQKLLFGLNIKLRDENYREMLHPARLKEFHDQGCRIFFYTGQEQRAEISDRMKLLREEVPAFHICLPGEEEKYGGCLAAGRGFIHISAAGDLEPCPFVPYSDSNLASLSLTDALDSSLLDRIRSQHRMLKATEGRCMLRKDRESLEEFLNAQSALSA